MYLRVVTTVLHQRVALLNCRQEDDIDGLGLPLAIHVEKYRSTASAEQMMVSTMDKSLNGRQFVRIRRDVFQSNEIEGSPQEVYFREQDIVDLECHLVYSFVDYDGVEGQRTRAAREDTEHNPVASSEDGEEWATYREHQDVVTELPEQTFRFPWYFKLWCIFITIMIWWCVSRLRE